MKYRIAAPAWRSLLLWGALIAPSLLAAQTASNRGSIVGIVLDRVSGMPLPYSAVSIAALDREVLSDDRGVFRLDDLRDGTVHIRVRHLGYAPGDSDLHFSIADRDTVRIALQHIAVRLTPMQVVGTSICTVPGAPSTGDSTLVAIFDQLKLNAEQYRTLVRRYPFVSAVERNRSEIYDPELRPDDVDTLILHSGKEWRYEPGAVLRQQSRSLGDGVTMNIPTLVNFGDPGFIANHCFSGGGTISFDNVDLIRIDFLSAEKIRDPDVDGSIYLDAKTFQIRRSVLRLNKFSKVLPELTAMETTTIFGDLFPFVPTIAAVSSVMHFTGDPHQHPPLTGRREDHRLLGVRFTDRKPGEEVKRPDEE